MRWDAPRAARRVRSCADTPSQAGGAANAAIKPVAVALPPPSSLLPYRCRPPLIFSTKQTHPENRKPLTCKPETRIPTR